MAAIPAGFVSPLYGDTSVHVPAFRIDKAPVTRAQYLAFVAANPSWSRELVAYSTDSDAGYMASWDTSRAASGSTDPAADIPASSLTWSAAFAYCASVGKRLPTPAEWEHVARAPLSRAPSRPLSSVWLLEKYSARLPGQPLAGSAANIYGVRALHDRLWEMVLMPFSTSPEDAGHASHMFCASASIGAPDPSNYPAFLRYAARFSVRSPDESLPNFGFRCASSML